MGRQVWGPRGWSVTHGHSNTRAGLSGQGTISEATSNESSAGFHQGSCGVDSRGRFPPPPASTHTSRRTRQPPCDHRVPRSDTARPPPCMCPSHMGMPRMCACVVGWWAAVGHCLFPLLVSLSLSPPLPPSQSNGPNAPWITASGGIPVAGENRVRETAAALQPRLKGSEAGRDGGIGSREGRRVTRRLGSHASCRQNSCVNTGGRGSGWPVSARLLLRLGGQFGAVPRKRWC